MSKNILNIDELSEEAKDELLRLGLELKKAYSDVLDAPVPERYITLIEELEALQGEQTHRG